MPLSIGGGIYSVRKDRSALWAAFGLPFYRLGALMSAFRTLTVLSNASGRTIGYRPETDLAWPKHAIGKQRPVLPSFRKVV